MKICDLIECSYDFEVVGISDDSRDIKEGYVFVATKGFNVDHFDYINDAIKNGAIFVVCDREVNINVPYVVVENINDYYVELCSKFYDVHPDEFNLIGITGTDGKTTTSTIIYQLMNGMACIGTNGVIINDEYFDTHNTTPCVSELYNSLSLINCLKANKVSLEAHIFPHGPHGVALADETAIKDGDTKYVIPLVATWIQYAVDFVKR